MGLIQKRRETGEREELSDRYLESQEAMRYGTSVPELGHISHRTGREWHKGALRILAAGPK